MYDSGIEKILFPWAKCDNEALMGGNEKYNSEVAPKIAKLRLKGGGANKRRMKKP
jgi:hypothetical protein